MRDRDPLRALSLVLGSVDAVRNTRALFVLLATFACAGLLVAMAETSFVTRPGWWGPLLFGVTVPVGVLTVGLAALSLAAVVMPLAAPAVWSGASAWQVVNGLARLIRERLLQVALLMALVSLLTAGMGALVTSIVMVGGRVIAELGVMVVGVDVPPRQLMAGLFGYGLRSLGAAGAPHGSTGHASAALVGGGVVFALALVLPGLVYLRGACAVYLAMCGAAPPQAAHPGAARFD